MKDLEKIEKIFRMLGSEHDGEILNAVCAIRKILNSQNKNFSDLSSVLFKNRSHFGGDSSDYYAKERPKYNHTSENKINAEYVEMFIKLTKVVPVKLNEWENKFVNDIYDKNISKGRELSEKQKEHFYRVYNKYCS